MSSVPTAPLLASRSSAEPLVCRAIAEFLGMPEEEFPDALADELDEPVEPLEPVVPADAAAVAELEDVEAGVGEN